MTTGWLTTSYYKSLILKSTLNCRVNLHQSIFQISTNFATETMKHHQHITTIEDSIILFLENAQSISQFLLQLVFYKSFFFFFFKI